jgi:hypothetical protein
VVNTYSSQPIHSGPAARPLTHLSALRCRIEPYLIKAAPGAPLAGASARPLPWRARPARADPHVTDHALNQLAHQACPVPHAVVVLWSMSSPRAA